MNRRLSTLEQRILGAVERALPAEAARILRCQIEEVNLVQRTDREVNLYRTKFRFLQRDYSLYFANRLPEVRLAEADLSLTLGDAEPAIATVWLVSGRVFSIEFSSPLPREREETAVARLRLLLDPQVPESEDMRSGDPRLVYSWMEGLGLKDEVVSVRPPLPEPRRSDWLQLLWTRLPDDWISMIGEFDGFVTRSMTIHGLLGLPHAHFSDVTLLVLAEKGGSLDCLCVRGGSETGEVLLADYEGKVQQSLGQSFREALREYVGPSRNHS